MPTYEGLRLKILEYKRLHFAKQRRAELKQTDFTIISNNCWGGMIYESYDLPKETPTVGMFFMASDYIRFLQRLKEYITVGHLTFINPQDSKWKEEVSGDKRFGSYPVGVLKLDESDPCVEIFFLHYRDKEEALNKWTRRCKRINWNNLIVKFNDQNGCTEKNIDDYINLPFATKLFFTARKWSKENNWKRRQGIYYFYIHQFRQHDYVMASYELFGRKITKILNGI